MLASTFTLGRKLIMPGEAARILCVNPNTLRRWCDKGLIKPLVISARGDRRFDEGEINALKMHMGDNDGY
jgi:DNA-binding transcriptional MerR regulator